MMGKVIQENLLAIICIIGGILGLVKSLHDYQNRKLEETRIRERESSVGETALKKITDELKRLEDEIRKVDNNCEERDRQARMNVSNFFEQTWNILNKR